MSDAVGEKDKIKEQFTSKSKREGLCSAFKVFELGSNGTVYTGCGLEEGHDDPLEGSDVFHIARQQFDDGSVVTFKWPL